MIGTAENSRTRRQTSNPSFPGYKHIAWVPKHHRVKKVFDAIDEGLASLIEAVVREETDKTLDPDRPGLALIDDGIEAVADIPESLRARESET